MSDSVLLDIRETMAQFETRTGIKPTTVYLGKKQNVALMDSTICLNYAKGRLTLWGCDVFFVDSDHHIACA